RPAGSTMDTVAARPRTPGLPPVSPSLSARLAAAHRVNRLTTMKQQASASPPMRSLGAFSSGVLAPDPMVDQRDSTFSSIVASPTFAADRTAFASAILSDRAPALFRTTDGA